MAWVSKHSAGQGFASRAERAFNLLTKSPGDSDVMSLSEQVLILGVRADAKSVTARAACVS